MVKKGGGKSACMRLADFNKDVVGDGDGGDITLTDAHLYCRNIEAKDFCNNKTGECYSPDDFNLEPPPLARHGGKRRRRTRKKRRRIGKNKKEMKRLESQYRRFRIAKGDKRFKGTKNLVKWSRKSTSKRKGKKKRSRRIYHRKRRK